MTAPAAAMGSFVSHDSATVQSWASPARLIRRAVVEAEDEAREIRAWCIAERETIAAERELHEERLAREEIEAHEAGFRAGVEQLAAAIESIRDQERRLLEVHRHETVDAAIAIAEAILRERLDESPARWIGLIEPLLRRAKGRREIVLVAAPATAERLESIRAAFVERVRDAERFEIVADPGAEDGALRIETEIGSFATSLRAQLDAIRSSTLSDADLPEPTP